MGDGFDDGLDGVIVESGVVAIADLDVLPVTDVDVVFTVELLENLGVRGGEVLAQGGEVGGGVGDGFDAF
ncbi:MAG: hypothetical protein HC771_02675 [Synechococcales cyanobacterium CRU_2_2]|nr:hypothetical protein [Synechococcales cyanobacterium CRU_2_2]